MGLPPPLAFYLAAQRNAAIQATLMSQYGPMAAYWTATQGLLMPPSQQQAAIPNLSSQTPAAKPSVIPRLQKSQQISLPQKGNYHTCQVLVKSMSHISVSAIKRVRCYHDKDSGSRES